MTMFHVGRRGFWTRCVARSRPGYGVRGCPGVGGGSRGHMTLVALAGSGGGTVERSERSSTVSTIDTDSGLFTINSGGTRTQYFDGETGELVAWRDRRSPEQRHVIARRAVLAGPSADLVAVNAETPEQLRKWFGDFERAHGVRITEYNKEAITGTFQLAHDGSAHIPASGDVRKDRQNYALFMKRAVYNTQVLKRSPSESVDSILRANYWGPYSKRYRSGR